MLLRQLRRDGLFAKLAAQLGEDEHANGRREVGVLALRIHAGHQIAQPDAIERRNLLERCPEGVLQADAGLVAGNDDRTFDDGRFSCLLSSVDGRLGYDSGSLVRAAEVNAAGLPALPRFAPAFFDPTELVCMAAISLDARLSPVHVAACDTGANRGSTVRDSHRK